MSAADNAKTSQQFASSIRNMVVECFQGTGDVPRFTGEDEGQTLLTILDVLSARAASTRVHPTLNTVVAHVRHLVEAISGSNGWARTGVFVGDFDEAWRSQAVDEAGWADLKARLRKEYDELLTWLGDGQRLTPENLDWTLSILPHCAYHLGAIRQLATLAR